MKAVVDRILENNLNELKGLSIEGEIPFTEEFLNELVGIFLASGSPAKTTFQPPAPSTGAGIDFSQILNKLDKKELKIELKEKLAVLKISVKKF
jgi:hypothetical protein